MIISIDTKNNKAFLLSVPRDLWVDIGDNGHGKINEAYVDGQNNHFSDNGYPAGGMGQLQQVIENNFGLTINYYALVNYNAFRDAVNAVGGIDVVIKSTDPRGLYDPEHRLCDQRPARQTDQRPAPLKRRPGPRSGARSGRQLPGLRL